MAQYLRCGNDITVMIDFTLHTDQLLPLRMTYKICHHSVWYSVCVVTVGDARHHGIQRVSPVKHTRF